MNSEKKLKRAKKKDKKNKKTVDNKNKVAGKKQNLFVKPLPILTELPNETVLLEGPVVESVKKPEHHDSSDDEEANAPTDQSEVQMLDSLTGIPYPEDELLFAVPVVAPYGALINYK